MAQSHLHLTDRVSIESLPRLKLDDTLSHPTSYAEVKSPVDPVQLEDGSLRPANGSVSAYSWENLGMLTHIAAVGIVYGTVSGVLYSVRVEPETCNNAVNIEKRRVFGEALLKHERNGAFIVYYDETNYTFANPSWQ
ncbi:hypothetical protein PHYSODRAFT_342024 [Phytophthora sojae]|uniref:Uncharacterized protein n=1 Tax=Phytophthora sojae (strain P6497) TaxID=1094619 RepID=G5AF34_PHYSP|nr:hypothetical protein PHYSODRAFT_342024 [Phytophthora sojae]EGZ05824.1 hypothetical protein PHYSODRAFT_342024 [Phytophthora sojae]|eukprot:XP_009538685.1 hypothetical protein PHYSODRAFT_342024 [Phytophthora sojae]